MPDQFHEHENASGTMVVDPTNELLDEIEALGLDTPTIATINNFTSQQWWDLREMIDCGIPLGNGLAVVVDTFVKEQAEAANKKEERKEVSIEAIYSAFNAQGEFVLCMDEIYQYDAKTGIWSRVTPETVADYTRDTGLTIGLKHASQAYEMMMVNRGVYTEVAGMNPHRIIPTNHGLLDFHNKGVIKTEEAKEHYIIGDIIELDFAPWADGDIWDEFQMLVRTKDGVMDAWEMAIRRYGLPFLTEVAIQLFGRTRKEIPYGWHDLSDYGKSKLGQILAELLPGSVLVVLGEELTREGAKWNNIERAASNNFLVIIDEVDKVSAIKGRLNSITQDSFNTNPKFGKQIRVNRLANYICLGGGPLDTDMTVQGVDRRMRRSHRFPLEEDRIIDEHYGIREVVQYDDPLVRRRILSGLVFLAWSIPDHDAVMAEVTEDAASTYGLNRKTIRAFLDDVVVKRKGSRHWTAPAIANYIINHESDLAEEMGRFSRDKDGKDVFIGKERLVQAVGVELKQMGYRKERIRSNGVRKYVFVDLDLDLIDPNQPTELI